MFTQRRTEYTLEIYGPRNQVWRPAHGIHGDVLKEAIKLAEQGQSTLAIDRASDFWIAQYGHMHDISFRVRCSIEEIHAHSLKGFKDELSTADVSG